MLVKKLRKRLKQHGDRQAQVRFFAELVEPTGIKITSPEFEMVAIYKDREGAFCVYLQKKRSQEDAKV